MVAFRKYLDKYVILITLLGVYSVLFVLFDERTSNLSSVMPMVDFDTSGRIVQDYVKLKETDFIPFSEASLQGQPVKVNQGFNSAIATTRPFPSVFGEGPRTQ
jgi:hypothetical protein